MTGDGAEGSEFMPSLCYSIKVAGQLCCGLYVV